MRELRLGKIAEQELQVFGMCDGCKMVGPIQIKN